MLRREFTVQYNAFYNGEPIASILCIFFGDTCTYVHGVSGNIHRNVMAPYLLQWHAMQIAKARGIRYYNLGGVAPAAASGQTTAFHGYAWDAAHTFTGITRFKVGFGGSVRAYPPGVDIILRPALYGLYTLGSRVKKML